MSSKNATTSFPDQKTPNLSTSTPMMSSNGGNHSLGLQQQQQHQHSKPAATAGLSAGRGHGADEEDQALDRNRGRSPGSRPMGDDPEGTAPPPVISKKDHSPPPNSITQKRIKVVRTSSTPLATKSQSSLPSKSRINVIRRSQSPTVDITPSPSQESPKLDYAAKNRSHSPNPIKVIRPPPNSRSPNPSYSQNRSQSPTPPPNHTASSRSQSSKVDYSANRSNEKSKGRTPILTVDSNLVATARKPVTKRNSPPPTHDSNLKEPVARIAFVRTRAAADAKSNSPPPCASESMAPTNTNQKLATNNGKSRPPPSDSVVTARANTNNGIRPRQYASNDKFRSPPQGSNAMKRPPPLQDSNSDSIEHHAVTPLVLNAENGSNHDGSAAGTTDSAFVRTSAANAKSDNSPPSSEFEAVPPTNRKLGTNKGKSRPPPSDSIVTARVNGGTIPRQHASNDKFRAPPTGSNTMKRPPTVLQQDSDSDSIGKNHAVTPMVLNEEKGSNYEGGAESSSSMPARRRNDDADPDNRFVSLVGPQRHLGEDDDEESNKGRQAITEEHQSSNDTEPGAFAISKESSESQDILDSSLSSFKSTGSNNAPFQVEAMLVPEGNEYLDPPDLELIRRELLSEAVEADAVDVNKIRRTTRCRILVVLLMVVALVVGLGVGLSRQSGSASIVVFNEQSAAPTVTASDSPSAAPTIFTIALCSPYVFVEDVELYLGGFTTVVQDLNDNGINITLEEMDICAPQSLSAFNIAIDRYNEHILILNSQLPPPGGNDGGGGGSGGNNPGDSPPSSAPPENRRNLLSTLDDEVLLLRYALGVLFFSTGGENWEHNANWLNGTNADYCKDWDGIRCEFGGSLLNIDLSDNELQGTIPTEIALFVDLERLRLDDNELRGLLPSEIGLLSNLEYLDFQRNILTGEIPEELGELTRLDHLNGYDNRFTGTLNPALSQMTLLEFFGFEQNDLTGSLPSEIGLMSELESLRLGGNNLSGSLPSELDQLTRLLELYLDENNFDGPLPGDLLNLERIVEFTLEGNALTGPIPPIDGLRRVRTLNFGSNFLTSTIPTGFETSDSIVNVVLADLREITFRDNLLTGPIPTQLGLAPRLGAIHMERNLLSGFIPSEIGTLSRLTHLGLEGNRLQGFPPTLGQLTNLERLLLSGNPLNATIPTEIGKMVQLTDIEVENALVRGSFVSELGLLPRLSSLNFANNLLTGASPLITSANFASLSVSNNQLAGPVPPVSVILDTEIVNLSVNLLTGTIPTDYGTLLDIKVLNLRDNTGIMGTIPSELGELRTLELLFLQGTSLTGSVPMELCDLRAVTGVVIVVSRTDLSCGCCTSESDANAPNNGNGNPGGNNDGISP